MYATVTDSLGREHTLDPCPFCNCTDLHLEEPAFYKTVVPGDPPEWDCDPGFVACHACGVCGPCAESTDQVVSFWNDRTCAALPISTN